MDRNIKVIAFSRKIQPSGWVGVIRPLTELASQGHIEFSFHETMKITKKDIAELDVLICIRGSGRIDLDIIKECRRLNKYVIYYTDDDLLHVPGLQNVPFFNYKSYCNMMQSVMINSDCLWTTNRNICRKYGPFFKRSFVANAPALLLDGKGIPTMPKKKAKPITIGFAGGFHYKKILEQLLEHPIGTVLQKYGPRVNFEFFGPQPVFVNTLKFHHIPHMNDPEEYRNMMLSRCWDIGLAPLPDSEYYRCKYFNKFLEYGAIGAAGIYSSVEPFTFVVKSGVNGMLVDHGADNWTDALIHLIENKGAREKIRRNAWELLRREHSLEVIAEQLSSIFEEIGLRKAPACKSDQVRYKKMYWPESFYELLRLFELHGARAFLRIFRKVFLRFAGLT